MMGPMMSHASSTIVGQTDGGDSFGPRGWKAVESGISCWARRQFSPSSPSHFGVDGPFGLVSSLDGGRGPCQTWSSSRWGQCFHPRSQNAHEGLELGAIRRRGHRRCPPPRVRRSRPPLRPVHERAGRCWMILWPLRCWPPMGFE